MRNDRKFESHQVEKNTTDLYQALTSLVQNPQELAIPFACWSMILRQKIVSASTSPKAKIQSDNVLVKRLFLKALKTDFQSDAIASEIKPLLKNINVSDEDSMFTIGQASAADSQRIIKWITSLLHHFPNNLVLTMNYPVFSLTKNWFKVQKHSFTLTIMLH